MNKLNNIFKATRIHNYRCFSSMKEEKQTVINGKTINYLKIGKGNEKLVFLPGALGTIWSDFKPQLDGFDTNKFTIIAWDPIGYGKSRPPDRDFSDDFFSRDAEYLAKLLKEINYLDSKISLLGWSDGGITSLIFASKHPEIIKKMIIWGANAYVNDNDMKNYNDIKNIDKWSEKMRKPLEKTYGYELLSKMMIDWCSAMEKYYNKNGGDICKAGIKNISCPTLILHGDKDPVVGIEHLQYLEKELQNTKTHRFQEGKHNIHLRYSEDFNRITQEFLLS